jgi:hypothetical protein
MAAQSLIARCGTHPAVCGGNIGERLRVCSAVPGAESPEVTPMNDKKFAGRFTIQFIVTDPAHIRVINLLNNQSKRSKAQYIANAVLHYETCGAVPQPPRAAPADERLIQTVVQRLLEYIRQASSLAEQSPPFHPDTLNLDDAVNAFGSDGLDAIKNALDAFRS